MHDTKIIPVAGFKHKADFFILTAQAQVGSCVHMNEAKRSNSNINDKKQQRVYFICVEMGLRGIVLFRPDALLTDSLAASTDNCTVL